MVYNSGYEDHLSTTAKHSPTTVDREMVFITAASLPPRCPGASHQLATQGELRGAQQDLILEEFPWLNSIPG